MYELPPPSYTLHKKSCRNDIGRLERDEIDSPRMTTIRNLAAALDVEPVDLLDDE
jgi:hypothetical protein